VRERSLLLCSCFLFCLFAFCFFFLMFLEGCKPVFKSLTDGLGQFAEAVFAERFALVIVHSTLERPVATVASETCRMPNLADSRNTIVLHNLLATRTDLTEQFVVVELAVCLLFMLIV